MAKQGLARQKRSKETINDIVKVSLHMFLEKGYTKTTAKNIGDVLEMSTGNLTYYFPTKEHILALLVKDLCDFQREMMEIEINEGKTSLMALCLELTAMAAICDENEIIRDFYISAYTSPMTLDLIRRNDAVRAKEVFAEYCEGWSEGRYAEAEALVSGIEYATIMTTESSAPLDLRIAGALNSIMMIYQVPIELRRKKIEKVLALDYRALGRRILGEFKEFIEGRDYSGL